MESNPQKLCFLWNQIHKSYNFCDFQLFRRVKENDIGINFLFIDLF
ncbi:hypothetical protein SAMN05661044_03194 [Olivibacter domesticus]|uniref:Uncharacterized protein n=1 Tax=Olivibacter domesticus TaxID=407022 RepID=A0A1H7SGV7_OLID1|nr:hypothetical protein SAMN05661044_03194 [Olivibacter domesticus]